MQGYFFLGLFVFYIVSIFAFFIFGIGKGKKDERKFWEEAEARKAKDAVFYQKEKTKIMTEVFGDAENKKVKLQNGTPLERFNNINNSLRGNTAN
jgi:Na+-transporting methylmalonyl-CoA/oxaloacetate decarboxylase gamma subunit